MDENKKQKLSDKIMSLAIWSMLSAAVLLLVFPVIFAIWPDLLSNKMEMRIFLSLIGFSLIMMPSIMIYVNLSLKDEEHVAVAPYAGKQKVGKKWALFFNVIMLLMGLFCLVWAVWGVK